MKQFADRISQDRAFYVAIATFVTMTFAAAMALGDLGWFIPGVYLFRWLQFVPGLLAMVFIVYALQSARAADPMPYLMAKVSGFVSQRAAGLLLFTCLAIFHGSFTSMKSMLPEFHPFAFDPFLANLDEALHGQQPWMHLQLLNGMTEGVRFLYSEVWFLLVTGVTFTVCLSQPGHLRSQYIWTFMFCWAGLGILIAACFMSAGPIFYDRLPGPDRFVELAARLNALRSVEIPSSLYPDILWQAYITRTPGIGTGISAFPSLHLAMATLFALAAFRYRDWLGWVMLGYLAITMMGSVHLGWHYAVDGYFSMIATTIAWVLIGKWLKRSEAMQIGSPVPQRA